MKNIIIVGAAGFGRELLQWIKEINKIEGPQWHIRGFLDDNLKALEGYECDYSVIGTIAEYEPQPDDVFAIALADPTLKKEKVELLQAKGAEFVSVIHPESRIGDFNKIGKGVIIYPSARITVNAELGDFVVLLDNTTIGHDAKVGSFTTICGNCSVNGHVEIGTGSYLANHVSIVPSRKVGNNAYVGAGSVVINNVKDGYRVFGAPAKKIML